MYTHSLVKHEVGGGGAAVIGPVEVISDPIEAGEANGAIVHIHPSSLGPNQKLIH